jgi:hypothetical protein
MHKLHQPDHKVARLDPRPKLATIAMERGELAVETVPRILPASYTDSHLKLMIWSTRARNRSPDPVISSPSAASSHPRSHGIHPRLRQRVHTALPVDSVSDRAETGFARPLVEDGISDYSSA